MKQNNKRTVAEGSGRNLSETPGFPQTLALIKLNPFFDVNKGVVVINMDQ